MNEYDHFELRQIQLSSITCTFILGDICESLECDGCHIPYSHSFPHSRSCFNYPYQENWFNGTKRLLNLEGGNMTIEAIQLAYSNKYGISGPMNAELCIKDGGIDCSGIF